MSEKKYCDEQDPEREDEDEAELRRGRVDEHGDEDRVEQAEQEDRRQHPGGEAAVGGESGSCGHRFSCLGVRPRISSSARTSSSSSSGAGRTRSDGTIVDGSSRRPELADLVDRSPRAPPRRRPRRRRASALVEDAVELRQRRDRRRRRARTGPPRGSRTITTRLLVEGEQVAAAGAPVAGSPLGASTARRRRAPPSAARPRRRGPPRSGPTAAGGRRRRELALQLGELELDLGRLRAPCRARPGAGRSSPERSVRAPDASSSSTAPARACMLAILSWARCIASPVSLIDSEIPRRPRRSWSAPAAAV